MFCVIVHAHQNKISVVSISEARYEGIHTCGIYADFSLGARVYQDVEDTLKQMEIGILGICFNIILLMSFLRE